jgi:hypothetical protein
VALQLAAEEPEAGPWRVELLSTVVNAVNRRGPDRSNAGRPAVLAVDGRSNNGKTTVAARICDMVPEHGREGSIDVPAGCPLVIIEGDGAGRREVAPLIDTLIWVQADEREAGRRAAARAANPPAADLANKDPSGAPFDEDGWMAEEIPFNAAQRTWERADVIVCGTPETPHDPSTEIVIAPPTGA